MQNSVSYSINKTTKNTMGSSLVFFDLLTLTPTENPKIVIIFAAYKSKKTN